MATSVPKSYQAKSKHPITTAPAPASGQAGPAPITFPHTFTESLFQVPSGKTWQVIKFIMRNPPPQELVEFLRIDKASSGGAEQIVLMYVSTNDEVTIWPQYEIDQIFQNVVLEDQEIIRQVVRLPKKDTKLTMEYELSVLEFTP